MHPYKDQPDYRFYQKEAALRDDEGFDIYFKPKFTLTDDDKIVTAGSCFAQRVAKSLQEHQFNFLVTETPPPYVPEEIARQHHYYIFPARFGNIYTPRQLKQLIERAYGDFTPIESYWQHGNSYVDPLRPNIQPGGFISIKELETDRSIHLEATRKAFDKMSVFIFTLGLTEAWIDSRDGCVLPLAPGVSGGTYDPSIHKAKNFSISDVLEDLKWCIDFLLKKKPKLKIILTVSPIHLNATFEDKHVFQASTYSKSVLRVAAEEVARDYTQVDYFPSFEIINNPFNNWGYVDALNRAVTPYGVECVMYSFLKAYTDRCVDRPAPKSLAKLTVPLSDPTEAETNQQSVSTDADAFLDDLCDEEMLSND